MSLTYQTEYFKSSLVTSSYENALRITGPLWWETPHKVPIIRCSVLLVPQAVEQQIELPVIWDAMTGMCRHCDVILDENIKPWTFWIFWEYICLYICSCTYMVSPHTWWRHQMETFSALLAICVGNSPVPGVFPAQRPVTRSFDVFFNLRPNKR